MTVPIVNSVNTFIGDGSNTVFPTSIFCKDSNYISVIVDGVIVTNYTVSGVTSPSGVVITFAAAPVLQAAILVSRVLPLVQPTIVRNNAGYFSNTVENLADNQMMIAQQTHADVFAINAKYTTLANYLTSYSLGMTGPKSFGAVGDGVTDDYTAITLWIAFIYSLQTSQGLGAERIVLDFGRSCYATSQPIIFPATSNVVVQNMNLKAIGTGWNISKYLCLSHLSYSSIENPIMNCNRLSNGMQHDGLYTKVTNLLCFWMSAAYLSCGYDIPSYSGGLNWLINANIRQWNTFDAEFSNSANFTATLVRCAKTDNEFVGGTWFWGRVCYAGDYGIHRVRDVHMLGGAGRTDPIIFEMGKINTAELTLSGIYHDNGISNFYNSTINFNDIEILSNSSFVTVTDGILRFLANGVAEPFLQGRAFFYTYSGSPALVSMVDYGANTWSAKVKAVGAKLNAQVTSSNAQLVVVEFANTKISAFFNVNGAFQKLIADPQSYLDMSAVGAIMLNPLNTEPLGVVNGTYAYSDGTVSTNGFGGLDTGLYLKQGNRWNKVLVALTGKITLTTTPQAVAVTDIAGGMFDIYVVATNSSGSVQATVVGHGTTAVIVPGSVVSSGTAITLSVSGTSIMATVAGTLAVNTTSQRVA